MVQRMPRFDALKSDHDSWWKERKCFGNSIQILLSGHEGTFPGSLIALLKGWNNSSKRKKKKILRANFSALITRLVHLRLIQSALADFCCDTGRQVAPNMRENGRCVLFGGRGERVLGNWEKNVFNPNTWLVIWWTGGQPDCEHVWLIHLWFVYCREFVSCCDGTDISLLHYMFTFFGCL